MAQLARVSRTSDATVQVLEDGGQMRPETIARIEAVIAPEPIPEVSEVSEVSEE